MKLVALKREVEESVKRDRNELRRARERLDRKRDQQASSAKLLELALDCLRKNDADEALMHAQRAIQTDQCCVPAYLIASRVCLSKGNVEQAIEWCQRGGAANLQSAELDCELGSLYSEQGNHDKAIEAWRSAIQKDARMLLPYENLAVLFSELERFEEAEQVILSVLAIEPKHNAMRRRLASNLRSQQRYEEAVEILRALIETEPAVIENYRMLAAAHRSCNNTTRYVETLQQWLEVDPENATVKHMLSGADDLIGTPSRADDGYVRDVFDQFAATFDKNLDSLQYRGPAIIEELLVQCFGSPPQVGTLNALDAGCGTGLCGPKLRPYCKHLVGVDLSNEMIKIAIDRKCYDRLEVEELTTYLKTKAVLWDLVVAADTFNYFGDLNTLFEACHGALITDGLLLFTLEHDQTNDVETYRLNANGRYCHSSRYVESMLVKNHFDVKSMNNQVLRREADQPVDSIVVVAKKRDSVD